ncbi:transposase IS200 family protein [Ancylomarina subtilis]|uniref:Transposase IS200 family protein n=1 Tax=Ancylomarina subtilis TaxID=1639035 RepID=A0A4Q7VMD6_9BACT|nr:transposase [Ancylomarina subtilis]RZT97473.1 transposase IS200 family protein [Ancylomarina subtilis]
MVTTHIPLEFESYYHVYNRGINRCDLFQESKDYKHFLRLYEKYIEPIADTFAWVLMPNHFHLLIRIKSEKEIGVYKNLNSEGAKDSVRFQTEPDGNLSESEGPDRVGIKKPNPTKHFSHLFNAYAKYINKKYQRTGSLFEHPFRRKQIDDETYLMTLVLYIHNNPIHHGFTDMALDYPWSSYLSCLSDKPTRLLKNEVVGWFDEITNFKFMHQQHIDFMKLEEWLEI